MSPFAVDVDEADFRRVVVEGSRGRLVVVDFWAAWCGPCRVLKPLLEKLAEEYQGRFHLAKVDTQKNAQLATQYSVRSIPSVKAFLDGKVVDEFAGALPEGYVREFLERNIPSEARKLAAQARELVARGSDAEALAALEAALALEPDNASARVDKAALLLRQGKVAEAGALVKDLRGEILDYAHTQALLARLRFAEQAEQAAARRGSAPGSGSSVAVQDRLDLAARYVLEDRLEQALAEALAALEIDPRYGDGAARKSLLAIFDILGPDSELTKHYRRRMAQLLH